MSELVQPTPAPATVPVPPPAPAVKPNLYVEGMRAKEVRMHDSWWRAAILLAVLSTAGIGLVSLVGELQPIFAAGLAFFTAFAQSHGLPSWSPVFVSMAVPASLTLGLVQLMAAFLVWWERKVAAHMQLRLGPMNVGGWHGWAQTFADAIKLLLKQTVEPDGADKWVYRLAPVIVFAPVLLTFAPIPFGRGLVGLDLDTGLLFVMAVSGLSTIGILMAGWGSANKFSVLGGLRAAAQVVSFEIPRLLSIVPVVMWAGTLRLTGIVDAQSVPLWGWFPHWFIFYPFVGQLAFLVYLITTIAETNRVPFDIPEAESELVAGFHTEYGGMKFAIFFLSEYAYVFAGSLLGAALFLGGGAPPLPWLGFIPSWAWFMAKAFAIMFVFLWSRWTFPRLRVDRVMDLCWKVFIPWTLINIVVAGGMILWRAR